MGVGGQLLAPSALPPGEKTRYPWYRRLRGPQGRSELVRINLTLAGIRSPDRRARCESLNRLSCSDSLYLRLAFQNVIPFARLLKLMTMHIFEVYKR